MTRRTQSRLVLHSHGNAAQHSSIQKLKTKEKSVMEQDIIHQRVELIAISALVHGSDIAQSLSGS